MKTLIVYYSRTGTTEKAALALKARLAADVESLQDKIDYSGVLGYLKAGRAALKKALTEIGELKYDPANYDLVIIGSPVWAGLCAPVVRTYIENNKGKLNRVAPLCTQGGNREQKIFADLETVLAKSPVNSIFFTTKEVRQDKFQDKLDLFVSKF